MNPLRIIRTTIPFTLLLVMSACADSDGEAEFWNSFDVSAHILKIDSSIEIDAKVLRVQEVRVSSPAWREYRVLLRVSAMQRDHVLKQLLVQMEQEMISRGFEVAGTNGAPDQYGFRAILYKNENRAGHVVVRTCWVADPLEPGSRGEDPRPLDSPVVELSIDFIEGRAH